MASFAPDAYDAMIQRLIEARRAARVTQADLAGKLGKSQSFVHKWETKERRLDPAEFLLICALLGQDPARMLGIGPSSGACD